MSFKVRMGTAEDNTDGSYRPQIDERAIENGSMVEMQNDKIPNFHLAAYKDEEDEEKFKNYKVDLITYKTIRAETTQENWTTIVRLLSYALIVFAIVKLGFDIFKLVYSLFYMPKDNDLYTMDKSTLVIVGVSDSALRVIDIISDIFIFIQGFYGIKTANDHDSKVSRLINMTIIFTLIHIVAIILKLIISSGYVDNYNWNSMNESNQLTEDEIQTTETFIYGVIIATFFLNCIFI